MRPPLFEEAERSQRTASDPGASVFVTANAGSGKTKVLIDRIARLLLAGAAPSSFLCITFTKAAAAEMQRRLFERLGAWSVAPDADLTLELKALIGAGGDPVEPDAAVLARARALFARALETPGGLRIQTIHAFCERLLARFPLEAGVAAGFQIADDARARALVAAAWEEAARAPQVAKALSHIGAKLDSSRLEALLAALTARRGSIGAYLARQGGAARALAAIAARHGDPGDAGDLKTRFLADTPWSDLLHVAAALRQGGAKDQDMADKLSAAERSRRIEDLTTSFLTDKGEVRKNTPTAKMRGSHPFTGAIFDREAERVMELQRTLRAAERVEDSAAALVMGEALAGSYAAAKADAGALDFDDLIGRAHALLTKAEAAPWVLYKLDGGVDHILIDEGQDTSPDQWRLIEPLQQEFFAGAGAREARRTVFAVGDPKQSIYAFQGADPEGFKRERQRLEARARAASRLYVGPELVMSFRSCPEVLQAVDLVFSGLDAPGDPPDFDGVRHTAARAGQTGLVEWWPIAPKPEKVEPDAWDAPQDSEPTSTAVTVLAQALAERVRGWIAAGEAVWDKEGPRPMRPGDVLALVRARGPVFTQLLRAFKRAGLPVAGADRMTLREEIAVQDLLALAKAALDPDDDLSLACVLKSPLCDLTDDDADLFPLAHGRAAGESLARRLEASGDARLAPAQALVREAHARAGDGAYPFFAWALERLDEHGRSGWRLMLERLGEEARDPIEELLERALQAPEAGLRGLLDFAQAIDTDESPVKREMEDAADAVRVMTVHGSKGLEAPVVILADTTSRPDGSPAGGLFFTPDGPILSPSAKGDDDVAAAARAEADAKAYGEHLRLLYVAMTRARDRLIVAGRATGNGEGAPAQDTWHAIVERSLRPQAQSVETPFGPGLRLGAPVLAAPSRRDAAPDAAPLPAWAHTPAPAPTAPLRLRAAAGRQAVSLGRGRLRGKWVHALLQRLPELAPDRRADAARAWLLSQGATADAADALTAEALAVMAAPEIATAFGPRSRAEAAIAAVLADGRAVRGVVDRLMVTDADVLILEYKSDRAPPETLAEAPQAHLAQAAAYWAALRQTFSGRSVRAALVYTRGPRITVLPEAVLARMIDAAG